MATRPQSSPPRYILHNSSSTHSPAATTYSLPSPPSNPNRLFFDNQPHTLVNPSPSDGGKQLQHYFEPGLDASFIDTSSLPISSVGDFMSEFDLQHPGHGLSSFASLPDNTTGLSLWNPFASDIESGVASPLQTLGRNQAYTSSHTRTPSSSTMASQTTASPTQSHRLVSRPRVSDQPSRARKFSQGLAGTRRQSSSGAGSHLPTPTHTPTHDTFRASTTGMQQNRRPSHGQNNGHINHAVAASLAMNEAMISQPPLSETVPSLSHSYSNSSQHRAAPIVVGSDQSVRPAQYGEKPEADIEAWIDQYLRYGYDSDYPQPQQHHQRPMVPKFERTVTDAYNDELYLNTPISVSAVANGTYLSPTHASAVVSGPLSDRLQAAQMARSTSSNSSNSHGLSPYHRSESPWVHNIRPNHQLRPTEQPDLRDLSYQASPQTVSEPKTISPKEAMLDYKPDENEQPLFPPSSTTTYPSQQTILAPTSSAPQQQYPNMTLSMAPSTAPGWGTSLQSLTAPAYQSYSNFMVPNLPMGGLPLDSGFLANAPRNPEFPAQLTTMDSSASEAAPPSSLPSMSRESPKPADSSAHTGTYSCTYHGCTERFSTPQKLQRHKKDAHRRVSNVTPGVGSGMSTAQLAARNSQSGPHKCERINPTTNKPCNTIFSRPYDLTRHEDTIHNIRKQKVRCALCQEEKTFSRADALTRHLRVVHPEVDFPGKHRRRGGSPS